MLSHSGNKMAIYAGAGLALGAGIGLLFGDIASGAGVGVAIGAGLSLLNLTSKKTNSKKDHSDVNSKE